MKYFSKTLPYTLSFTIPIITLIGTNLGDYLTFSTLGYAFVLLPLTELFLNPVETNFTGEEAEKFKDKLLFSLLLWLHVIFQYAVAFNLLNLLGYGGLSTLGIIGVIISSGISMGALGITVAHELIHRKSKFEQFLGKLLLLSVLYLHFFIEHIRGHHKKVGTDADPASAKFGESFYLFLIRTVIGSYFSAWKLETERLRMKKVNPFSLKNQMIIFTIFTIAYLGVITLLFGLKITGLYIITSVFAFSLLEAVNYIEHYGLERKVKANGKLEKVQSFHSWNSNFPLSRWVLFELTRHSDHHLNASKKYQVLNNIENSPEHPAGYPGMIFLALIPPLWKKVMDKKVIEVMNYSE